MCSSPAIATVVSSESWGGGIVYSVGADKNRQCKVATFKRWTRKAQRVHQAASK